MSHKEQIVQLLMSTPGLRTVQLVDKLDLTVEDTQTLLKEMQAEGAVTSYEVDAPSGGGRKATAWKLAVVKAPWPTASHAATTGCVAPVTNAERAIAFIAASATKSATSAELHKLLGLDAGEYASGYLKNAVADGRLVKDGKDWTLGPKAPGPVEPATTSDPATNDGETGKPKDALASSTTLVAPEPKPVPAVPKATAKSVAPVPGAGLKALKQELKPPHYRCALWSDGILEVQKDGTTVAEMPQAAGESLAAFLARLTREKAAA